MSDLANQKILFSFGSLLQVPGGLTSSLQDVTDGNGVSSGLQISTTGIAGTIVSDTVDITGGTIDGTTIGSVNPYPGKFSTLTVDSLTGILKASAGLVTTATSSVDYAPATSGTSILKGNGSGGFSSAVANTDYQSVISATGLLKGAGSGSVSGATAGVDYSAGTSALATGIVKSTTTTGVLSIAVSGTDYAPATSGTSILKGNGAGGFSNASSGTDYAPATSGNSILYGNGAGGFSNVTVGSGLQFSGGTLTSTSGGGSVTTVSVVSANGFAGTVANASSTPAITLTTSVTGLLKGNGTAISAAAAGTDYQAAITATGILKGSGAGSVSAAVSGTDYAPGTSSLATGLLKSTTSTGALSIAASGTDYAPATSGTSILKGDGAGGFSAAVAGTDYAGLASANTFTNNQVISVSSASDALRITQTGAGNALLVEDSANPDSTPFVVDGSGNVGIGGTPLTTGLSIVSTSAYAPQTLLRAKSSDANSSYLFFQKDRAGSIVQSGDNIGVLQYSGFDGASYIAAASIAAVVDGTPGTNDMPGRLVFSTTADGASSPTERMRIDNAGRFGFGTSTAAGISARFGGSITGSAFSVGVGSEQSVQSDVTTAARIFQSRPTTQATTWTLGALIHFYTNPQAFGVGTTVTNQYGFHAESTLTGATNNYGFYSNIASGTGRYNFYAAGTAANYFAGVTTHAAGLNEQKTAPSISAGTLTLDCSAGNVFAVSLNANITTLSFSNVPTTGTAYALTLSFTADGTARTVTWGSAVKWPSGNAPTLTSTNAKVDTFVLTTWDGGTTWYAFTAGQNA